MATFLRDQRLQNLTLTADRHRQIDAAFQTRLHAVPERNQQDDNGKDFLFYVIRFDNKGYRVFSIEEVITYFQQADSVERVIFTIESGASVKYNRNVGTYMELRLDAGDTNACHLVASSDDADWVDASFSGVLDAISRCKNRHSVVRNDCSVLSIQIGGVLIGFLLSLWAAVRRSPFIQIENSFLITFLFVLLVFSNLWTFVNQRLLWLVSSIFPNIRFYRPDRDRLHWLIQALIGGIAVAVSTSVKVGYLKAARHAAPRSKGLMLVCIVAAAFFALLIALSALGHMPMQLLAAYALLSVITFVMYGFDKAAAGKGRRRTPEATLLFAGLIGGWPGALVAQRLFRHKIRKQSFQAIFWCGVVVNCGVLVWLVYTGETASVLASLGFG